MCVDCQRERDHVYELAIDERRTTEDQAVALMEREHLCDRHAAAAVGADVIGRRNAYDGTPWTTGYDQKEA